MKVELVKPIQGQAYFEGDVVEVDEETGAAWCEAGHAIPAKAKVKKEEAENAASKAKVKKEEAENAASKATPEKAVKGKVK